MKGDEQEIPWHSRFDLPGITFVLFLFLVIGSLPALEGSVGILITLVIYCGFSINSFQLTGPIYSLQGLWKTIQIGGNFNLCRFISFPFSVSILSTRMILNLIRTIPSLLWAILVVLVGSNSLAGVIALSFYSIGYLAKFFSETMKAQTANP